MPNATTSESTTTPKVTALNRIMTRRAILLSQSTPSRPIAGGHADADSWQHFLRSNPGGAWTDQEISHLSDCDRDAALAAVRAAKDADYSLIVYIGAGRIEKGDLPWPEAHGILSSGGSLSERELNPGTRSCTIVF